MYTSAFKVRYLLFFPTSFHRKSFLPNLKHQNPLGYPVVLHGFFPVDRSCCSTPSYSNTSFGGSASRGFKKCLARQSGNPSTTSRYLNFSITTQPDTLDVGTC